ncbi:MAG: hypothetical protein ABIP38_04245, partial [Steroidobacteraceae bacterium]
PLILEAKVSLGSAKGRIDHLAVDTRRLRLFVAELGNNSVGVIDLGKAKLLPSLNRLDQPQGVLFVAATDELYVSNGGDGSIRVFAGEDLVPTATVSLGSDADNLRLDPMGKYVVAGYGNGGLAKIDVRSHRVSARIPLQGHPEAFQLSQDGRRAFVNVPEKHEIAIVDIAEGKTTLSWPVTGTGDNFPLALETSGGGLWVGLRGPPRLLHFDTGRGEPTLSLESCEDSDDLFIDNRRRRLYVICGSGHVDVWEQRGTGYERIARIATSPGARTGLYVPELDRLYIASRANASQPASILVFRPGPD